MGTNEPPEHWAPPESLDPTPVWRQYVLVALLVVGIVVIVVAYVTAAVAPDVVTPPALVPGNRLVLASNAYPPGTTKLVDLAGPERAFFLVRLSRDEIEAVRLHWVTEAGRAEICIVRFVGVPPFTDDCTSSSFDEHGKVVRGSAPRGLDRYLVSRKGERLIVNLDRPIPGASR